MSVSNQNEKVNTLPNHGVMDYILSLLPSKKITYSSNDFPVEKTGSTESPQPQEPTHKYQATTTPEEYKPALQKAYSLYPSDLNPGELETLMMMESSMGANRANETADLGKYGWLTGLVEKKGIATDILKNKNVPYAIYGKDKEGKPYYTGLDTVETPEDALGLTASAIGIYKRNNPQMSFEDIYFKLYNGNAKLPDGTPVDTPENRQKFREYLQQYQQ